jgi:hypothetical protein
VTVVRHKIQQLKIVEACYYSLIHLRTTSYLKLCKQRVMPLAESMLESDEPPVHPISLVLVVTSRYQMVKEAPRFLPALS